MIKRVSHALLHSLPRLIHQRHVCMDQLAQVSEPNHHFYDCPVQTKPNQGMFNNVDSTNVVTNTNDEEVTIPPGYYSIGEIIVILNTMTDSTLSISTRIRVMDVSGSSSHTLSTSPMLQIFDKSLVWKDVRSFYMLRSMDRT